MTLEMEMTHKSASFWVFSLHLLPAFVWGSFFGYFGGRGLFPLENDVEKLLALTLETLGSKEVARWLVWLQNTEEHG